MEEQINKCIAECEQKHEEAVEQMQKWAEARLRAEGALMALRSLLPSNEIPTGTQTNEPGSVEV